MISSDFIITLFNFFSDVVAVVACLVVVFYSIHIISFIFLQCDHFKMHFSFWMKVSPKRQI